MKFISLILVCSSLLCVSCKDEKPKKYSDIEIVPALEFFQEQQSTGSFSSCGFNLDDSMNSLSEETIKKYDLYQFEIEPLWKKRYKLNDQIVQIYGHKYWKQQNGYLLLYSTHIGNDEMDNIGVEARLIELDTDGSIIRNRFFAGNIQQDDNDILVCRNLKLSDGQYGLEVNRDESENIPPYLDID